MQSRRTTHRSCFTSTKTQDNRCKMVYKAKKKAKGEVEKHKVRLVAKRYSQSVDYDEVFALIARLGTVRSIISLAASLKQLKDTLN